MILALGSKVIYGLLDPRDGIVRYIGQTLNPSYRYAEHLRCPKKEPQGKNIWIQDLQGKGMTPIFLFLDSVPEEEADECERKWINHFAKLGVLFNHKVKAPKKDKKILQNAID